MRLVRKFLIGSSVAIFPIIYLGMAYNKLSCGEANKMKVKYANLMMGIPLMYGATYVVLSHLLRGLVKDKRTRLFVLGAIAGELYSLIGHFGLEIPETLLLSKNPNSVHIIAPVVYAFIYGFFVHWLENTL
jgi:hypothetical protein